MSRRLSDDELNAEWSLLTKNWYSIYQWERTAGARYTSWIADKIDQTIADIKLCTDGLRERSFRIKDHRGQIKPNTDIRQLTEKRLLRAMFNSNQLSCLGTVIDYEVPLKEKGISKHGDIDLLCLNSNQCLCIEAKKPKSSESILKAVLQAYAYTSLVATKKDIFLNSFDLDQTIKLAPAVLTFSSAKSGRQLTNIDEYRRIDKLIRTLNAHLKKTDINPISFYLISNLDDDLKNCLTLTNEANGDKKAVFRDGFQLAIQKVEPVEH